MRRYHSIIFTAFSIALVVGGIYLHRWQQRQKPDTSHLPEAKTIVDFQTTTTPAVPRLLEGNTKIKPETPEVLEINLAVPFQSQAPRADWSLPYKEACEEASIIMATYYIDNKPLSVDEMEKQIQLVVDWEQNNFGRYLDTNVAETAQMAERIYQVRTRIIDNLTADKLRQELRLGFPVIVPAAGQELGNPNFRRPGPPYHMLVVKGFTSDGRFITNDPGTRNGADYMYKEDVLMNAIHDWTGAAADGDKTGLVIYK